MIYDTGQLQMKKMEKKQAFVQFQASNYGKIRQVNNSDFFLSKIWIPSGKKSFCNSEKVFRVHKSIKHIAYVHRLYLSSP